MDSFEKILAWLDAICVRGGLSTERGDRSRLLHMQGACEIRAPPKEDKGHLLVSASIRKFLDAKSNEGWKITVKYFAKTQTPSKMIGYCLKDIRQGWFNFACKGLSKRDLAKARHDHLTVKQSYAAGKELLEKKGFMYNVYKFYATYLMPLQLSPAQVVRLMFLSGTFAPGNSWILSPGALPLDVVKMQALWNIINSPEDTTIELVSIILFGDPSSHTDGHPRALSSVCRRRDHFAANTDVVFLGDHNDPNDTIPWEEAQEFARSQRLSGSELNLLAGHIFGENLSVPPSAIVSHRNGDEIPDVWNINEILVPIGADPEDATEIARPFSPMQQLTERTEAGWESDSSSEAHTATLTRLRRHANLLDDTESSEEEQEPQQPRRRPSNPFVDDEAEASDDGDSDDSWAIKNFG